MRYLILTLIAFTIRCFHSDRCLFTHLHSRNDTQSLFHFYWNGLLHVKCIYNVRNVHILHIIYESIVIYQWIRFYHFASSYAYRSIHNLWMDNVCIPLAYWNILNSKQQNQPYYETIYFTIYCILMHISQKLAMMNNCHSHLMFARALVGVYISYITLCADTN